MEEFNEADARQKLSELVREFDTAMLVTRTADAGLRARPMAVAEVMGDAELWFVTSVASPKMGELAFDPHVLVTMQKGNSYLSVSGEAEVQRDPERIQRLWSDTWRVWFRDRNDPELVLIRVRPTTAEYWDNSGKSGLRFALHAAKAYFSSEPMRDTEDVRQHAKVAL